MRVVCCRCEKLLDMIPATRPAPGEVSHGLCDGCAESMLAELDRRRPTPVASAA